MLISIGFFLFIFIFGPNNLWVQHKLNKRLDKINNEKQFYIREIKKDREVANKLLTNMDNLERYARERYWMKRDNEDVFLIIPTDDKSKTKN